MKKLLLSRGIPAVCLEPYKDKLDITMPSEGERFSSAEILEMIPHFDAYFCIGRRVTRQLIDAGARLRVIANFGVGYDNIDWEYATAKNIFVVNTPQAVLQPTAEFTVALIMAVTRGVLPHDRALRREGRCSSELFFNRDMLLYGKTLGILGYGRIGRAVGKKCQGLGMNLVYYNPHRLPEAQEKELGVTYRPMEEVVRAADVLTLHMPYTPGNRHLIDYRIFSMMKPTAYFINTARGAIVNEADLARALREKLIRGAALDVYENEPEVNSALFELENIVITPHVASCLYESRVNMAREAMSGLAEILNGGRPVNVVNPQLFEER